MRVKLRHGMPLLGLVGLWAVSLGAPAAKAANAAFDAAAADGSVAIFSTADKQLVTGDTDSKLDVFERSFDPGVGAYVTREVSTGPTGGNDAYDASYQGASADGRKVFFSTKESLVAADTDRIVDVYRHDPATGTTLVSAAAASCVAGPCGNGPGDATFKGATPDGKKAFFETSERLASADVDEAPDVYMRDFTSEPPQTVLVSQADPSCTVGACGDGPEAGTFVGASDSGERVFFETSESLAAADNDGGGSDIYLRDLAGEPQTTTPVSAGGVCPGGVDPSACAAKFRGMSTDGSRVFFTTSQQFSGGDTDKASDVYVWEGATPSLLSTGPTDGNDDLQPAIFAGSTPSGDTAFIETSEPLTAGDKDSAGDVYARDLTGGTTSLLSAGDTTCTVGGCGEGSENATFAGSSTSGGKVFFSTKESLEPADEDALNDVYVRDLAGETTVLASRASPACEAGACGPAATVKFAAAATSGDAVVFSTGEPLVEADEDESEDVYLRDLGAPSTALESVPFPGLCPLPTEQCAVTFAGASEDVAHVFFLTAERLSTEDVDSELDVYERSEGKTRLVSTSNSVDLGPATPVLTATSPASPGASLTPSILGHTDANTSIKLYTSSDCSGEVVAGTAAQLEGAGIAMTVAAGSTTSFRATATDANGDTSGCSNAITYKQESPTPPGGGEGGGGGSEGSGAGQPSAPSSSPSTAPTSAPVPTHNGIAYVTPATRITFGPAFKTRARNPVFRFTDSTGQPGTSFVCRVDSHRWKPCESPFRLQHVSRGKHVFQVKARNAVGVWEASPTRRAFKLVGGSR